MIQQQTLLKVADNSGAKIVKCIKVIKGFKKKYATIGEIVVISVRKLRNNLKKTTKIKKKEVSKAIVIRTKKALKKKNGFELLMNENSIVFLNKNDNPIGTRIIGPIPKQFKKKFQKFISIAPGII